MMLANRNARAVINPAFKRLFSYSLEGKTAVITGAASGFGRSFAQRAASLGMNLVLADIDLDNLKKSGEELNISKERIVYFKCDVSKEGDIKALADLSFDTYGKVNLLFNNAGIAHSQLSWEHTTADWEWTLGVNLWSIVHAHRHFIPRLLKQDVSEVSHIINTASAAGFLSPPGGAAYNASKHAVVAISETLYHEFLDLGIEHVGVSVLCPAFVPTGIANSSRIRPQELAETVPHTGKAAKYAAGMQKAVNSGKMTSDEMTVIVFEAIKDKQFYILPHKKIGELIVHQATLVANEMNPTLESSPKLAKASKSAKREKDS